MADGSVEIFVVLLLVTVVLADEEDVIVVVIDVSDGALVLLLAVDVVDTSNYTNNKRMCPFIYGKQSLNERAG